MNAHKRIERCGFHVMLIAVVMLVFVTGIKSVNAQEAPETIAPITELFNSNNSESYSKLIEWLSNGSLDPNMVLNETGDGTAIVHYAAANLLGILRAVIASGGRCNLKNTHGAAPLHFAAAQESLGPGPESIRMLVECGGDIDLQDSRGATPLHAVYRSARSNGNFFKNLEPASTDTDKDCFPCSGGMRQDILQALLESDANPNIRDNGGDTPLMLVIKTKGAIFTRLGHMRLLLEYGADPDAPDNKGATPLIQAILSHSGYANYGVPEEIINTLLEFRADPDLRDGEGDTALIHAAKDDENTLAEIEALLAGGADPCLADRNGKLPYDHASEGSSVRNVLYKAGGNFDKELGMCARDAHAAMEQENELNISRDNRRRIQSCLMALGYNPGPADGIFGQRTQDAIRAWQKSQGYSASGYFGSGQAVELLEACEVTEPANQSETPQSDAGNVDLDALAEAMRNTGKYDNVHIQGVRNEDVNANDKNGYTSLHVAAANDHTRVVEMLIAAGADVHARTHDEYESTPLIVAAWGGRTRIVEVLIAAGANVNASNIYDATVLMGSALGGHTRTVEVLISAGANVYARNIFGHTSLHVATVNGHTRVVEVLISAGADVNANDKKGYTPLKLAVYLDHDRIADILRAHGARF